MKLLNVSNMFLMGFGYKNNGGTPGAIAGSDPSIMKEGLDVGHNDSTFVRAVMRLPAANGWGSTSVNTKFETKDVVADTHGIKAIQVIMDDGNDFMAGWRGDGVTNDKVLVAFSSVTNGIPRSDIRAIVDEDKRCFHHCLAIFLEKKDAVVDVITILKGNIMVQGLRVP
jgi:hypothetical protein